MMLLAQLYSTNSMVKLAFVVGIVPFFGPVFLVSIIAGVTIFKQGMMQHTVNSMFTLFVAVFYRWHIGI